MQAHRCTHSKHTHTHTQSRRQTHSACNSGALMPLKRPDLRTLGALESCALHFVVCRCHWDGRVPCVSLVDSRCDSGGHRLHSALAAQASQELEVDVRRPRSRAQHYSTHGSILLLVAVVSECAGEQGHLSCLGYAGAGHRQWSLPANLLCHMPSCQGRVPCRETRHCAHHWVLGPGGPSGGPVAAMRPCPDRARPTSATEPSTG